MSKFFLQSKTIIGLLVMGLGAFNLTLPFTSDEVAEFLVLAEKLAGMVLIFWGRWTAKDDLRLTP